MMLLVRTIGAEIFGRSLANISGAASVGCSASMEMMKGGVTQKNMII